MPILKLKNAEKARDAIVNNQKKQIAELYKEWAKEIEAKAKFYERKNTASAPISAQQMRELNEMLINTSDVVYSEIERGIKQNMYQVSAKVLENNSAWLQSLGFSAAGINAAFNHVPDMIVRNIVTGQIYATGWSLSAKIWGDKQKALQDAYRIIAKGRACNMSSFDVANELEKYVNPSAKKQWNPTLKYLKRDKNGKPILDVNGKPVYEEGPRIYKKQVDYNAQRLARTLTQHAYQQSFVAATEKNPFIEYYIWRANGSRACELCLDRDGQKFAKDELPLDHPNGMCTMDLSTDTNMVDRLADWINAPEGTYLEIDEFSKNFGSPL